MSDYRRAFVPGGSFFLTIVTAGRAPLFEGLAAVRLLGQCIRAEMAANPFTVDACVLLPDHWHILMSLPSGDSGYSRRIGRIKSAFTRQWRAAGGSERSVSDSQRRRHEAGVWQPRFWEHTCESECDFETHFDYVHVNPLKHRFVKRVRDWPHSTFHRWVAAGVYGPDWGTDERESDRIVRLEQSAGEP